MEDVKTVEQLQAEILALQNEKSDLLTSNEALGKQVEELEKQIETMKLPDAPLVVEKAKIPEESFKVGNVEYVFTMPQFNHNKNIITAANALNMPDLLKELVKMEFGGIKRKGE